MSRGEIEKIKQDLEKEALNFTSSMEQYIPPVHNRIFLLQSITEYILREGKRIRPLLLILSYLGYSHDRQNATIYRGALGIELIHLFTLIHDDIIDRSAKRRGLPSLHKLIDEHIAERNYDNARGEDYALIIGDIIYSLGLQLFMSMHMDGGLKTEGMLHLMQTAVKTGFGELFELYDTGKEIDEMKRQDLLEIYINKSSLYSFACPLTVGSILGEAEKNQNKALSRYGQWMGCAFQIKDDLLDVFDTGSVKGRNPYEDIKGRKKTLLLWHAYSASSESDRRALREIFRTPRVNNAQCGLVKKIYQKTGVVDYARREIEKYAQKAQKELSHLTMDDKYKTILHQYCLDLLGLNSNC